MNHDLNITIRPATDQDSTAILDLLLSIWVDEHHFDVKREDLPDLQAIEKYYINAHGMFFAVHESRVIGTIACQKLNEEAFALKRMFVEK